MTEHHSCDTHKAYRWLLGGAVWCSSRVVVVEVLKWSADDWHDMKRIDYILEAAQNYFESCHWPVDCTLRNYVLYLAFFSWHFYDILYYYLFNNLLWHTILWLFLQLFMTYYDFIFFYSFLWHTIQGLFLWLTVQNKSMTFSSGNLRNQHVGSKWKYWNGPLMIKYRLIHAFHVTFRGRTKWFRAAIGRTLRNCDLFCGFKKGSLKSLIRKCSW